MKKLLTLTVLMTAFSAASAAPLADNLPAGALLTLETHNAGPALDRVLGLIGQIGETAGQNDVGNLTESFGGILKSAIGQEATLGVFSVADSKGGYAPGLLAVSKLAPDSQGFFASLLSKKKGAKIGKYAFARQDGMYAGMGGGLVYLASDKALLMSYLGRLSGKAAPRLGTSPAYSTTSGARGEQEFGLYLNFSATAKLLRGQLGKVMVPRLLSPIVDAVDTLGQYASGFSTTDAGLNAQSAHLPNPAGKDRPLYSILTHTSDFAVQNVIPASAESVTASACAAESSAYLGRWLTRFDLLDPTGFLTDSQLAAHLEQSARYLGDECAQVTFAGGGKASLTGGGSVNYSASYQRVDDMEAARLHMPEYAKSVNEALRGLSESLNDLGVNLISDPKGMGGSTVTRALRGSTVQQLGALQKLTDKLQMVYAFRGDYLITAFSDEALNRALDEQAPTLADDAEFQAADLSVAGVAGWSYGQPAGNITTEDVLKLYTSAGMSKDPTTKALLGPVSEVVSDLYNRYGGMSSQSTVEDGVILSRSAIRYDW